MKKLIFSFLLFFSSLQLLSAQVPGYLGKRLFFGYYATGFTRVAKEKILTVAPGYAPDIYVNEFSAINVAHNFDLNYVVSRNAVIGITVEHFRTGLDFYYKGYTNEHNYFSNISSNWVLLNEKKFSAGKTGAIAPLGLYNQFSIGVGSINILDVKNLQTNKLDAVAKSLLATPLPALGFFYETGFQKIIIDRLMFTGSMRFGFVSSYVTYSLRVTQNSGETTTEVNQRVFTQDALLRLWRYQFLNLHVGLAYIVF